MGSFVISKSQAVAIHRRASGGVDYRATLAMTAIPSAMRDI